MARSGSVHQPSFTELGTPLYDSTFVVVDLETTGGSPEHSRITEIGAVKVRAGEVLGEFQSLVNPGMAIPASITALTGISDALVRGWPPIEAVLPAFLEFCQGAALVAHNARFDTGFLNANLLRLDYPRLENPVVCTAALARRLVADEVRNCKLATLAAFFHCRTEPVHRALLDARATVEVLHGLLERAGAFGVVTLEDLIGFAKIRNTPLFKARRHLADALPHAPGVYAFRSASGEVLYVGKATDLHARVRTYFGGDERRKITDMLKEAEAVEHWVCPTPIEAAVREVRMIQAHRPRFNRRSKTPERAVWLKLTAERFPRLSIVRAAREDGAAYLGPLASRRMAERVAEAIHEVAPIRRCTDRIGARTRFAACALAEMGRCAAPCDGSVDVDDYEAVIAPVRAAFAGDPTALLARLAERMQSLAVGGRFEEAAQARDRLSALADAVERTRRLRQWALPDEVLAQRPGRTRATSELVLVRAGVLVATATCAAGQSPLEAAAALRLQEAPDAAGSDERDLAARWLEGPGTVVLGCSGTLASQVAGGAAIAAQQNRLARARKRTRRPELELADKRTRRSVA